MSTLLFIEDDRWLAEMYADALGQEGGLTVLTAHSADQALTVIDEHKIDLIVLDMFLPGHNGIEFLHEIASYDDCNRIPTIILSAVHEHDFAMSPKRWREYGVVSCLYKPSIKPQTLVAVVKKQLLAAGAGAVAQ